MKTCSIKYVFPGFILVILIAGACTGNPNPVESLPWIPTDLASATENINKNCPEMVDPETRLDSVSLLPEGLSYYYTLPNRDKAGIGATAFTAFLLPEIIDHIRTSSRLEMFRDSSITILFTYRDRKGELITEFSVGPERYK